jgi:Derlin-2/3
MKYMPYIMLLMELLTRGPGSVARSLCGSLTGHIWWMGVWGTQTGGNGGVLEEFARAPQWLQAYFRDTPRAAAGGPGAGRGAINRGGGVQVIPPRQAQPAAATGGYNWGSGQRLGNN